MEHVRDIDQLQLAASALTIGSFDGVHLGHQALIRELVTIARQADVPAVALAFFPHPAVVLRGRKPALYITSPDERAELLGRLGVDIVVTQTFDRALASVRAEAFLERLRRHLGFQHLCIGDNFALGRDREGDRSYLEQVAPRMGFALRVFPPVQVDGEALSSSRVRQALRAGDVRRASRYLGRPFELAGKVVRGAGRGHTLAIPTANLEVWEERARPAHGVYACWAQVGAERLPAVTNIGTRPTFEGDQLVPIVEAHLLDFHADLYGTEMRLAFIDRLRGEQRFSGPEELVAQIRKDIERTRAVLGARLEGADA